MKSSIEEYNERAETYEEFARKIGTELLDKIICEKGMKLEIKSPIWLLDDNLDNDDDVLMMLSKNKSYAYAIVRPFKEMPASEIRDTVEALIKMLEEELEKGALNDGSV